MTQWALARIKGTPEQEALPLLPEKYHTYAVKRDGVVVGELKWDRGRWKSAGGPAWKGVLFNDGTQPSGCVGTTVHSPSKRKILDWFKTGEVPS